VGLSTQLPHVKICTSRAWDYILMGSLIAVQLWVGQYAQQTTNFAWIDSNSWL